VLVVGSIIQIEIKEASSMYDYISLYSDDYYSGRIKTGQLEKYLLQTLELKKESTLKFSRELYGNKINMEGILADENGNYAYDSPDGFE